MHVLLPPELQQQYQTSRRVDTGICGFPLWLYQGLPQVPPWCELTLGVTVKTVHGNQVPLEWTETFGGFWNGGMTP